MNKVNNITDQIMNSNLSLEEYTNLSIFLTEQIKDKLYIKFLTENLVSESAIRSFDE